MGSRWTLLRWVAALVGFCLGLAAAGALFAALLSSGNGAQDSPFHLADYEVYRGAVQSWLSGHGLYDAVYPTGNVGPMLPFTYPPFAALMMAPVALLPSSAAGWAWVLMSIAACPVLAALLVRQAPGAGSSLRPTSIVACALVSLGLMLSEPVMHGLFVGQVSIFIVLVSLVDAAGIVPQRWRGFLVGVASAVKLIPLVFVPYFMVTRQWRAVRNSLVGFGAATLLGFAAMPQESVRYWTVLVFDVSRVGGVGLSRNKSLLGLMTRWGLGDAGWLWLILGAAIAAAALWRARRHYVRGEELAATLVVGSLSIILTPISWPHHQIWVPLVALYLLLLRRRWPVIVGSLLLACYSAPTPLITWDEAGPLWQRLLWEVPVLLTVAIALFGLPPRVVTDATGPAPEAAGHRDGAR